MVAYSLPIAAAMFLFAGELGPDRIWNDSTGIYSTQAALVSFDSDTAVLRKTSGGLVAVPLDRLSLADQQYVRSQSAPGERTFILRDGSKLPGRVLDYVQKKVAIQRQYGKIFVDGEPYEFLSTPQLNVVYRLIERQYKTRINSLADFRQWVMQQRGLARELDFTGVLFARASGETLPVPFFLFSVPDQEFLLAGLQKQFALDSALAQTSGRSESSYPPPPKPVEVGVDLAYQWRVALTPKAGTRGLLPMVVMATGRTSADATAQAVAAYRNYNVAAVAAMQPSTGVAVVDDSRLIPFQRHSPRVATGAAGISIRLR